MRVRFLTVMPSPYVQDLLGAMAEDPRLDLRVWYLEQEAPNTHWGLQEMPEYAEVLPGRWIGRENTRVHWNPGICKRLKKSDAELFVIVGYIGLTNQIAMRWLNRNQKAWVFWGEVPGLYQRGAIGSWIRQKLQKPLQGARGIAGVGSHAVREYQNLTGCREVVSGHDPVKSFPGSARPSVEESDVCCGANQKSQLFANLPYVCDLREFTAAELERMPSDRVRFLFCGQLVERKGVDLLLTAFIKVAQESPNCTLTFVGDGPLRNELQQLVPASLADRVVFVGFQAVDALPTFFAAADVFVLPSRHDGWGVVVNQAVGAGLAVITTETVGAGNDLVNEGKNGFRIPANSSDALYDAIAYFTEHPQQATQFGKESRQIAMTISLSSAVDQWIRFFERSLATSN